jgi:O-antigen/teichoic acid export membrane protein
VSLFRDTMWSAAAAVVLSVGRFCGSILLSRRLGVSEYGHFVFLQWTVDITFLMLAFGLTGMATRYYAEYHCDEEQQASFERLFIARGLAVVCAVTVATPLFEAALGTRHTPFSMLATASWAATNAVWALLLARVQGLRNFKLLARATGAYAFVTLLGTVLLPQGSTAAGAAAFMAVATAAACLLTARPLPRSDGRSAVLPFDAKAASRFGINLWLTGIASTLVWSRGEIALVRYLLSPEALAKYSVALTLASLGTQGIMLLTSAVAPHLTALWGSGGTSLAAGLSRRLTDLLLLAAGAAAMTIILFSETIVRVTFGSSFVESGTPLSILGLGSLGLASAATNHLLQLSTNARLTRNMNIAGCAALFALGFPAVTIGGIEGAAIARTTVQLAIGGFTLYSCSRLVSDSADLANVATCSGLQLALLTITLNLNLTDPARFATWLVGMIALAFSIRDQAGLSVVWTLLNRAQRFRLPRVPGG